MRRLAIVAVTLLIITGCGVLNLLPGRTFHQRCGWKAEDYFTDPQVIALCHAIEANDIAEMERLVKVGADVNAQGKDKMTPLLWAFPDNHLPRFKWLLEHGANPNVAIESDLNTRGFMVRGDAVTHFVCKTAFPGYFEAVFEHGGDPNLRAVQWDDAPLTLVIKGGGGGNREGKIRTLIAAGADPNMLSGGRSQAMRAVSWGGQYGLATLLLDLGADHMVYEANGMRRLIHVVVAEEQAFRANGPQQKADYQALLTRLTDRGESIELARKDLQRWDSWSRTTGEYNQKMDAEIAERKAREKAAAEKKAK
jgi:ankyrin repeat protein